MSRLKNISLFFCMVTTFWLPSFAEVLAVHGIVEPLHDADRSASVAGKIETIHYREGQFVDKDTVVIQLESTLEQLEVDRRQIILDSKAELEAAIAEMETLEVDLKSTRTLFEKTGSISQEELDKKELEYKLAVAKKDQIENEEVREAIELKMSKFKLQERAIKAPFSGKIADIYLNEGEDCSAGEALFRIVDLSQCYFICNVEASLTSHLKKDQIVDLTIASGLDFVRKQGKIEFIAPTIDSASGLRKVKVLFENSDFLIVPGATGELNIKVNQFIK